MHWFWRAAIAVAVSASYMGVSFPTVLNGAANPVANAIRDAVFYLTVNGKTETPLRVPLEAVFWASYGIVFGVPAAIITLAAYALATRLFGAKPHDGETRCRKCDYILRGITEPRCPECGERI